MQSEIKREIKRENWQTLMTAMLKDLQLILKFKSKTKTVTSIGPLKYEDGSLITEDIDMAEMLNTFFASIFTQEETDTVPKLEPETGSLLTDIEIRR